MGILRHFQNLLPGSPSSSRPGSSLSTSTSTSTLATPSQSAQPSPRSRLNSPSLLSIYKSKHSMATTSPTPSPSTTLPSYPSYTLLFSDTFSGVSNTPINSETWFNQTIDNFNGEIQEYTISPTNAYLSGHNSCLIIPRKQQIPPDNTTPANPNGAHNEHWTSARLESKPTFHCKPGTKLRIAASITLGSNPAHHQHGIWPAFWTLGASGRNPHTYSSTDGSVSSPWPHCGEIDILETINGSEKGLVSMHFWSERGNGGARKVGTDAGFGREARIKRGEEQVWMLEIDRRGKGGWREEKVKVRVDGREICCVAGKDVGEERAWRELVQEEIYLVFNVAVGGSWPGLPTSETKDGIGSGMEIHWVGVWEKEG